MSFGIQGLIGKHRVINQNTVSSGYIPIVLILKHQTGMHEKNNSKFWALFFFFTFSFLMEAKRDTTSTFWKPYSFLNHHFYSPHSLFFCIDWLRNWVTLMEWSDHHLTNTSVEQPTLTGSWTVYGWNKCIRVQAISIFMDTELREIGMMNRQESLDKSNISPIVEKNVIIIIIRYWHTGCGKWRSRSLR